MDQIDLVLAKCLGVKGKVKKVRTLYLVGQTRVHVDKVEGLGDYMELEVGLIFKIFIVFIIRICINDIETQFWEEQEI